MGLPVAVKAGEVIDHCGLRDQGGADLAELVCQRWYFNKKTVPAQSLSWHCFFVKTPSLTHQLGQICPSLIT